jgi:hypothetical protein
MPTEIYPPRPTPPAPAAGRLAGVYLTPKARALLRPETTPAEYLKELAGASLYADAFTLIAHVLPPRLLVWWGCLCLRGLAGSELPATVNTNFESAVNWVCRPTEACRRAAEAAATASGPGVLGFRLVRAIAALPGDPRRSAEYVVEALLNAVSQAGPSLGPALARQFVVFGIDVERGAIPLPPPEAHRG